MKKTILIIGAGARLGKACAEQFHATGSYDLVLHYHTNKQETETLAKKIHAKKIIKADLTKPSGIKKLITVADPVDIVINTLGSFIYKPLLKTTTREFNDCILHNVSIAWQLSQAFLPNMIHNNFGRIINFGSVGCDQITARPLTTPYYIGKTGLVILTKSLATELMGTNVTINLVSPGVLPTGVRPDQKIPLIPFDAVARAVVFLVADENHYCNGTNLEISAGWRPE